MKRGLTLLLASLMLVVGLTACGGDTKQDHNQNDGAVVGGASNGENGGSANDRDAGSNGSGIMDDVKDGVDDAMRDAENAVNDIAGRPNTRNTAGNQKLRSGPAWSGNLQRPDFPVNPNSVI